jgi:hypothetical protein
MAIAKMEKAGAATEKGSMAQQVDKCYYKEMIFSLPVNQEITRFNSNIQSNLPKQSPLLISHLY